MAFPSQNESLRDKEADLASFHRYDWVAHFPPEECLRVMGGHFAGTYGQGITEPVRFIASILWDRGVDLRPSFTEMVRELETPFSASKQLPCKDPLVLAYDLERTFEIPGLVPIEEPKVPSQCSGCSRPFDQYRKRFDTLCGDCVPK